MPMPKDNNNTNEEQNTQNESFVVDGYDFSQLDTNERKMLKDVYFSEEFIGNFYLSNRTMLDEINYPESPRYYNRNWGFPHSGFYAGFVYDCYESKKSDSIFPEYTVSFLANNIDLVLFKFQKSFFDVTYNEIKSKFKLRDNFFRDSDFTVIKGHPVLIKVNNITTNKGNTYSKIEKFFIIKDEYVDLMLRAASIMLEQS